MDELLWKVFGAPTRQINPHIRFVRRHRQRFVLPWKAGMRCGGGLRLAYSNPMHLDDVAIDWPDMQIVMAHPSFPWQDEALSVATHKPNVWIDLSGWSPKYFPKQLVQYANTLLKDRVLFGSDYPLITPERWMKDFEVAGFKPEVMPGILKGNAVRLLGL